MVVQKVSHSLLWRDFWPPPSRFSEPGTVRDLEGDIRWTEPFLINLMRDFTGSHTLQHLQDITDSHGLVATNVIDLTRRTFLQKQPVGPRSISDISDSSDAVEVALKIARAATGRYKTLSFWDAFHGARFGAASLAMLPSFSHFSV